MKNIKEKLEQITIFREFAEKRAHEILRIRNTDTVFYVIGVEFNPEGVLVEFKEDTRHGCPDSESVNLPISLIEMSDSDFTLYLDIMKNEISDKKEKEVTRIKAVELKYKTDEFERLKKELGK